jgi:hypothetical protein
MLPETVQPCASFGTIAVSAVGDRDRVEQCMPATIGAAGNRRSGPVCGIIVRSKTRNALVSRLRPRSPVIPQTGTPQREE